jgi:septum formation protein
MNKPLHPALILASTSKIRKQIMLNAGLNFKALQPNLDEKKAKQTLSNISPQNIAQRLSELKSLSLATHYPKSLIIGADQVLSLHDRLFHKPENLTEARQQLQSLRGKTHILHSSLAISQEHEIIWQYNESAKLMMRNFSDAFLDTYLNLNGSDILTSVGVYKLEHSGIQLFEKIEGDYFTILGLPLMPLLAFLRQHKHIAT